MTGRHQGFERAVGIVAFVHCNYLACVGLSQQVREARVDEGHQPVRHCRLIHAISPGASRQLSNTAIAPIRADASRVWSGKGAPSVSSSATTVRPG